MAIDTRPPIERLLLCQWAVARYARRRARMKNNTHLVTYSQLYFWEGRSVSHSIKLIRGMIEIQFHDMHAAGLVLV